MIIQRIAICEKCGAMCDPITASKNYLKRDFTDWSNTNVEDYLQDEGFLPYDCPTCKQFNNYRE